MVSGCGWVSRKEAASWIPDLCPGLLQRSKTVGSWPVNWHVRFTRACTCTHSRTHECGLRDTFTLTVNSLRNWLATPYTTVNSGSQRDGEAGSSPDPVTEGPGFFPFPCSCDVRHLGGARWAASGRMHPGSVWPGKPRRQYSRSAGYSRPAPGAVSWCVVRARFVWVVVSGFAF